MASFKKKRSAVCTVRCWEDLDMQVHGYLSFVANNVSTTRFMQAQPRVDVIRLDGIETLATPGYRSP